MTKNAESLAHPFYEIMGMLNNGVPTGYKNHKGLTKREMIAMTAMQGLLSNSGGPIQSSQISGFHLCNCVESDVAKLSVSFTDALLKELDK
jgi:hypothetical protein